MVATITLIAFASLCSYAVSTLRWAQTTDVYIKISQLLKPHRQIRRLIQLTLWNKSGFIIQGANLWLKPSFNSCSSRQIAKDPLLTDDLVKQSLSGYYTLKEINFISNSPNAPNRPKLFMSIQNKGDCDIKIKVFSNVWSHFILSIDVVFKTIYILINGPILSIHGNRKICF